MALPTVEKTWLYKVNIPIVQWGAGDFSDMKRFWHALKTAITTASGWTDATGAAATHPAPWTVVRSSDGHTVSNSDLWTDYTKQVMGGGNHSWIVLQNGGGLGAIGGQYPLELCLDHSSGAGYYFNMHAASRGYDLTTGSVTARPSMRSLTSNVELQLASTDNSVWFNDAANGNANSVLHIMMTSDGKSLRVFRTQAASVRGMLLIEEAGQAVVGQDAVGYAYWPSKIIALLMGGQPSVSMMTDNSYGRIPAKDSGGDYRQGGVYFTTLFYGQNSFVENLTTPNDLSGEYPLTPIGMVGSTPGMMGRLGVLTDMWFGSTLLPAGDHYPSDSSRKFVHFGNLVVPWNGSRVVLHP